MTSRPCTSASLRHAHHPGDDLRCAFDGAHHAAAVREFRDSPRQTRIFRPLSRMVRAGMPACIAGALISAIPLPWPVSRPIGIGAHDFPSLVPFAAGVKEAIVDAHQRVARLRMSVAVLRLPGAAKHAIFDRDGVVVGMPRIRPTDWTAP